MVILGQARWVDGESEAEGRVGLLPPEALLNHREPASPRESTYTLLCSKNYNFARSACQIVTNAALATAAA